MKLALQMTEVVGGGEAAPPGRRARDGYVSDLTLPLFERAERRMEWEQTALGGWIPKDYWEWELRRIMAAMEEDIESRRDGLLTITVLTMLLKHTVILLGGKAPRRDSQAI